MTKPMTAEQLKAKTISREMRDQLYDHWPEVPNAPEAVLQMLLWHGEAMDKVIEEKDKVIEGLRDALVIVLPLAKGYAAEHPVGNNTGMVETAQAALAAAGRGK